MFEFSAASLVVTRLSLVLIETNAISSLSGGCPHLQDYLELGGKYHSNCVHTLFALYFLLNPHDRKILRVIKEYFMGKVMFRFIESNSSMAFAIIDIVKSTPFLISVELVRRI